VRALEKVRKQARPVEPEILEVVERGAWIVDRGEGSEDPGRRSDVVFPLPRAPGRDS